MSVSMSSFFPGRFLESSMEKSVLPDPPRMVFTVMILGFVVCISSPCFFKKFLQGEMLSDLIFNIRQVKIYVRLFDSGVLPWSL